MASETAESGNRVQLSVTINPDVVRRMDGARGPVSRSQWLEVAAEYLLFLLDQDPKTARAHVLVGRAPLRERMAVAARDSEEGAP